MRRVSITFAVGVSLPLAPLAGCAGTEDGPDAGTLPRIVSTELAAGKVVRLTDAGPVPRRLLAGPGDRITWRNESSSPKDVRFMDGAKPSGAIAPGGAYSRVFSTSGTFAYRFGKAGKNDRNAPDGVVEINLPAYPPSPNR